MSKSPKGIIVHRIAQTLIFLEEPHTVKELGRKLGITNYCAYVYITMLRKAGYQIRSRERFVYGKGMSPKEYSLIGLPQIVRDALELMRALKGM